MDKTAYKAGAQQAIRDIKQYGLQSSRRKWDALELDDKTDKWYLAGYADEVSTAYGVC